MAYGGQQMKSDLAKTASDEKVQAKQGLKYRTLSGLFWMSSGTAVQFLLRTLVMVILARLLTPEDYGLVGATLIVMNFAQVFSQLGMGPALIQRPHLEERHVRTAFTVFTIAGVLVGGLIASSVSLIAGYFQMDGLMPLLRVAALAFPIQGLAAVPTALMKRDLQFRRLAGINIVAFAGGYGLAGISLALLGFGAWALAGAMLARLAINVIVLLFVRPFPKSPQFERRAFRELMYFGGGVTLADILGYVAHNGDYAVVGRWLGTSALGVYNRAYNLLIIPASHFGAVLDQVLFPSLAKVQNETERLRFAYRYGMSLVALIILPVSVVAILVAPELILALLGPRWTEVVSPFRILAVGMLFRTAARINISVAHAMGAPYRRAWRVGINALCVVGGAWIGQNWGLSGVAGGVLIALAVDYALMTHFCLTLLSMNGRQLLAAHLPALVLAAVASVEVWSLSTVLRTLTLPAIVFLVVVGLVTSITLLLLVRLMPQLLLGQEGIWMLGILTRQIKRKFNRFERVKNV